MLPVLVTLCFICIINGCTSNILNLSVLKDIFNKSYHVECKLNSNLSMSFDYGLILINAKYIYEFTSIQHDIIIQNIPPNNRYSIGIYFIHSISMQLIGFNSIDIEENSYYNSFKMKSDNVETKINFSNLNILSTPRLSSYYSTINLFEAQAWQNISHNMRILGYNDIIAPNVETSIRSNSIITLYDLRQEWFWTIQESKINSSIKPVQQENSYYHERPTQFGYYCLYYKRSNEQYGPVPDCPNVTIILTEHAKMLSSSGIDFIALDDTNLDSAPDNWYSDVLQLRPAEIIYDTWYSLRNQSGTNTPDVVTWNKASGIEWKSYLNLYSQYPDMVLTVQDPHDNNKLKKVFFVPSPDPNQTVVNQIQNDFGKNDVLVQKMWGGGGMSEQYILNGTWTFFYPCRTKDSSGNWKQTVSLETLTECNFVMTQKSPLGTQISASMSWQNNYGSLPFSAPSKLNGRTFLLIIRDVLSMKPDNVLFPSFNEHTAMSFDGSQNNGFGGNNTWGVGLYGDPQRTTNGFFVDTFGSERARSIEASDESGDYYYRLMQSCIRVIRLSYKFHNKYNIISSIKDSNSICNINGEICCNQLQSYVDVWSLYKSSSNDYIVSNNINEVNDCINNLGYKEICSAQPYSDTTVFCMSSNDLYTFNAHRGPFIIYKDLNNPIDGSYSDTKIERIPIYRCITNNGYHFIAKSSDCDSIPSSKMEYIIGYAAISPSTAMPRRLVRCQNGKSKYYYHVVDDDCILGDISSGVLGYVFG